MHKDKIIECLESDGDVQMYASDGSGVRCISPELTEEQNDIIKKIIIMMLKCQ